MGITVAKKLQKKSSIIPILTLVVSILILFFGPGIYYRLSKSEKETHEMSPPPIDESSDTVSSTKSVTIPDEDQGQKIDKLPTEPSIEKTPKKEAASIPPVTIKDYKLIYTSRSCDFKIAYPQVDGLANKAFQSLINDHILQKTNLKAANLELQCEEFKNENPDTKFPSEWNVDYKVHFNRSGILSLTVTTYEYNGMGAHGLTHMDSFNFDLNEGKMIEFNDLFAFQYKEKVFNLLKKYIKEKDYDESRVTEFGGVYLTETDIVVFYGMYTIGPGAAGVVEIPMPIRAVKQYFDPKGPLAQAML